MAITFQNSSPKRIVIFLIILAVLIFGGYQLTKGDKSTGNTTQATSPTGQKVETKKIDVNQSMDIPVGTGDNKITLKNTVLTAQLTNRIVVSGKNRWARKGTKYLMLNLLIENPSTKTVNFKTKDLVRLIDANDKKFAPSFHNKDLRIEADAVKKDVVGFLVPDNIKVFKIQYGLISGEKKTLELKFE